VAVPSEVASLLLTDSLTEDALLGSENEEDSPMLELPLPVGPVVPPVLVVWFVVLVPPPLVLVVPVLPVGPVDPVVEGGVNELVVTPVVVMPPVDVELVGPLVVDVVTTTLEELDEVVGAMLPEASAQPVPGFLQS
jgi:hypothetical protein